MEGSSKRRRIGKYKRGLSAHNSRVSGTRRKYARRAPAASRGFFGPQARLRRQMQGILEKKFHDTGIVSNNAEVGGTLTLINTVAQGDDYNERIGRKYTITAVQVDGFFIPKLPCSSSRVRLLVVYDAQPNGAQPAVTDILTAVAAGGTAADSFSFMNLNFRDRFKVILEETFALGNVDTTAGAAYSTSPAVANIHRYVKTNLTVTNEGTSGAIGSISTGALWCLVIGSAGAGSGYTCDWNCRIRFVDA